MWLAKPFTDYRVGTREKKTGLRSKNSSSQMYFDCVTGKCVSMTRPEKFEQNPLKASGKAEDK